MTLNTTQGVFDLLNEEPDATVYQYWRITGQLVYAVFPPGQYDDMAIAPDVREYELLKRGGRWTARGLAWRKSMQHEDQ